MKVKNLKELRSKVEKAIKNSLEKEVFETVRNEEIKSIVENVFWVYAPTLYVRRETDGIDDKDNIVHDEVKNGTLRVRNITEFNTTQPKNTSYATQNEGLGLDKLIEYGHVVSGYCYDYPTDDKFYRSRPFTYMTIVSLKGTGEHIKALKKGLARNKVKSK